MLAGFIIIIILTEGIVHAAVRLTQWPDFNKNCNFSTIDGLKTAQCGKNLDVQHSYTPFSGSFPFMETVEALILAPGDGMEYVTFSFHALNFEMYPKLKRLTIRKNFELHVDPDTKNKDLKPHAENIYADMFVGISSLEYFEFSGSKLSEEFKMTLPKYLKMINVDDNNYQSFDAHWCSKLEDISVNRNKMKNVPKLYFPIPPLKKLHLKGNPMDDMSILDIAPLCDLQLLELEFTGPTKMSYCNCTALKAWAKQVDISGVENLQCIEPEEKSTCSDDIFNKARDLRKTTKCPLLSFKLSSPIYTIMMYVFFFVLLLLLLAVLILYIIRHFHLREWWREHHLLHSNLPSDIKIKEEEEESFQSQDAPWEESFEG